MAISLSSPVSATGVCASRMRHAMVGPSAPASRSRDRGTKLHQCRMQFLYRVRQYPLYCAASFGVFALAAFAARTAAQRFFAAATIAFLPVALSFRFGFGDCTSFFASAHLFR
jgi:hypothetical protein